MDDLARLAPLLLGVHPLGLERLPGFIQIAAQTIIIGLQLIPLDLDPRRGDSLVAAWRLIGRRRCLRFRLAEYSDQIGDIEQPLATLLLRRDPAMQLAHSRGHHKTVGIAKIVVSTIIVLFCGSVGVTG